VSSPQLAIGVDIGGTSVKAALVNTAPGPQLVRAGQSSPYRNPTASVLTAAVTEAVAKLQLGDDAIAAIGMCAPGIIDTATGIVERSNNLPQLVGTSVTQIVRDALPAHTVDRPMRLVSDALAAATGWEASQASATCVTRTGRTLFLVMGTGVGACVLDAGVPLIVTGPGPGHIGQLDVALAADVAAGTAPVGPVGERGSLESYVGLPALLRRYGDDRRLLAAAGVWSISDAPAAALTKAIRICTAVYRPQHIVLLGGVGRLFAGVASQMHAEASAGLTPLAREGWTLMCGSTVTDAAMGAALLAMAGGK